ncbi:MAG: hydrolase [Sedimentisphaerales bacterium]
MEKLYENAETGCCPRFEPGPWDKKEVTFKDKLFIKDDVTSFFHIPLNMNKVMVRNMESIAKAGALAAEPMVLCDENSLWGADIYIAVSKDVSGAEMVKLSGNFLSGVFEGPYKNIRQWIKQMTDYVREKGKVMKKLYFFYTTCPNCAKYYGKNYVVLLAQV